MSDDSLSPEALLKHFEYLLSQRWVAGGYWVHVGEVVVVVQ